MKKILIAALAFVFMMMIGTASAIEVEEVDLIADGGSDVTAFTVGDVTVTNDGTNLVVTYTITPFTPWLITETHVDVQILAETLPQNKSGNPKVGKFAYQTDTPLGVTTQEISIPIGSLVADDYVVIAAHAVVINPDELVLDGELWVPRDETAWADGEDFEGRNWAMYIETVVPVIVP